ncbi:expressed unknown protein [Seminavis robusta]|uniref:Uncharacterized protein n=1 Tax=Seminavis robusta TaxID=568900 RepID=A0A9N8F4T3_9STRA|nr:expressed unknown protein [Seminavis robusta]|eukprot:Sro3068_g343130.1 n/a (130) ;mRNA; r:8545-8934
MSSSRSLLLSPGSSDWNSELKVSPSRGNGTGGMRRCKSSQSLSKRARKRADIIRQKHADSQGLRRQLRSFRRSNSNASYDSTEEIVQKDAQTVSESLKAMEDFMNSVNGKHRRRKLLDGQKKEDAATTA